MLKQITNLCKGFGLICWLLAFASVGLADETGINHSTDKPIKDLNDIAQLTGGFERDSAVYSLVMDSNEKELESILEQSIQISRKSVRESIQAIAIQRFAAINPKRALSRIDVLPENTHHSLVVEVFSEWSQHELDAAISYGQSLTGSKKLAALQGILRARDDLSEELRREVAKAMGFEDYSVDLIARSSVYDPIESPEKVWKSITGGSQPDVSQVGTLIQIAQAWIEKDGLSVLDQIYSSISDWNVRSPILWPIVDSATDKDPESTLEYALGLESDDMRVYFVTNVIRRWASSDPQSALRAATSLDSSRPLPQLEFNIILSWAEKDPTDLLANIAQLPENWQEHGKQRAIVSIAQNKPEEAIRYLEDLSGKDIRNNVAHSIASSWVEQDPQSALDWIQSDPKIESIRQDLLSIVLRHFVEEDSQNALQIALSYPVEKHRHGLEADVIGTVAERDLDEAVEMLGHVREGHTKMYAYTSVGHKLIQEGSFERARRLGNQLTDSEQSRYYASMVFSWFLKDPVSLVDSLHLLPSEEIRSQAALTVSSLNENHQTLSKKQLDSVREFLSEEDLSRLSN
ncbi:MAG: hypothetical protein OXG24_02090 [Gammaproteobacteria bacterium]|nr:hypothetical protein [Gammaproteobacteria bacterium]